MEDNSDILTVGERTFKLHGNTMFAGPYKVVCQISPDDADLMRQFANDQQHEFTYFDPTNNQTRTFTGVITALKLHHFAHEPRVQVEIDRGLDFKRS